MGVIRIDIDGEVARFRRVAVAAEQQRQGHGRTLLRLSEFFSIEHGVTRVEASVAASAVEAALQHIARTTWQGAHTVDPLRSRYLHCG
ncbi:MAG: GNAT family N-acetyltransferase [Geminicoccales bacterium]